MRLTFRHPEAKADASGVNFSITPSLDMITTYCLHWHVRDLTLTPPHAPQQCICNLSTSPTRAGVKQRRAVTVDEFWNCWSRSRERSQPTKVASASYLFLAAI